MTKKHSGIAMISAFVFFCGLVLVYFYVHIYEFDPGNVGPVGRCLFQRPLCSGFEFDLGYSEGNSDLTENHLCIGKLDQPAPPAPGGCEHAGDPPSFLVPNSLVASSTLE